MISLITYFKSVSLSIISYYEKILILEIFFTISSHLISWMIWEIDFVSRFSWLFLH
jgi:hypothetical protein